MLLSPISNAGRTSRVLLADVILWINKASLALFIARVMPTTDLKFRSCTVLSSLSPLIEASKFEVESRSQTLSLRLRRRHQCGLDCVRTILTTFYHMNHVATGDVVKFFIKE